MKTVVIQSYYQLLHAVAWNMDSTEKPLLAVSRSYMGFSDDMIERIRNTGIFSDVIAINNPGDLSGFSYRIYLTRFLPQKAIDKIGSSLFDKYLMPYYSEKFSKADKDDEIYIYNDQHWFFYYVSKTFSHITMFEDGYASITQQLSHPDVQNNRFPSYRARRRYVPKFYPRQVYRDESISRIVSSKYPDGIPDFIMDKLDVVDYLDLVKAGGDRFSTIVRDLFDFSLAEQTSDNTVLIIGQAIATNGFVGFTDEYRLHKRMVSDSCRNANTVYLKPHPAEKLDFSVFASEKVVVLPKEFPIELLNNIGFRVGKVLTYSSTAAGTLLFAKKTEILLPSRSMNDADIHSHIRDYIKDVKLSLSERVWLLRYALSNKLGRFTRAMKH